jgi:hypothetical protein
MVSHLREVIHRVEYIRLDIRHHDIHLLRLDSVASTTQGCNTALHLRAGS